MNGSKVPTLVSQMDIFVITKDDGSIIKYKNFYGFLPTKITSK